MVRAIVIRPAQAYTYYGKDDYYIDQKSEWWGEGKAALKLSDEIRAKDWQKMCYGHSPDKQKLNSAVGRKGYRTGIDLPFSASKSISILSMMDKELINAHQNAVKKSLEYLQKNLTYARITENKVTRLERVHNIIAGLHLHQTSRELQPQLHTHAVIMNCVIDGEGERRALTNDIIFKNVKFLGQYYRNELALEVQKLGYKIDITDRREGFFEIKGISEEILQHFSLRRQQIEAEIKELKKKFPQASYTKLASIANLGTRKTKEKISQDEFLSKNLKELKEKFGLKINDLQKNCLEQKSELIKDLSPAEALLIAANAITANDEVFTRESVVKEASKYLLGVASSGELVKEHNQLAINKDLIYLGVHKGQHFYTTKEMLELEKETLKLVKDSKGSSILTISEKTFYDGLEKNRNKGIDYNEGQMNMIDTICTSKDQFIKIQGDAGAGKTRSLKFVTEVFEKEGYDITLLAPTGKAVKELQDATGIEGKTIAYARKSGLEISPKSLIIVDETSMVGIKDANYIANLAKSADAKCVFVGDEKQYKPIAAGDFFYRLNHTGIDTVNLTKSLRQQQEHIQKLEENFKYQQFDKAKEVMEKEGIIQQYKKKEILTQAVDKYLEKRNEYSEIARQTEDSASVVIVRTNKDREQLNEMIREKLKEEGEIQNSKPFHTLQSKNLKETDKKFSNSYEKGDVVVFHEETEKYKAGERLEVVGYNNIHNLLVTQDMKTERIKHIDIVDQSENYAVYKSGEHEFGVGDEIMFLKNDSLRNDKGEKIEIANGLTGKIEKIDNDFLHVKNGDEMIVFDTKFEFDGSYQHLTHAYAITGEKSQGATIVAPICIAEDLSFNQFYTAVTRASHDLDILTTDKQGLYAKFEISQTKATVFDFPTGIEKNVEL